MPPPSSLALFDTVLSETLNVPRFRLAPPCEPLPDPVLPERVLSRIVNTPPQLQTAPSLLLFPDNVLSVTFTCPPKLSTAPPSSPLLFDRVLSVTITVPCSL